MSEPEEVAVITVKRNTIYLGEEVLDEFKIRKGDKLVIYNDKDNPKGQMRIKIIHKSKT